MEDKLLRQHPCAWYAIFRRWHIEKRVRRVCKHLHKVNFHTDKTLTDWWKIRNAILQREHKHLLGEQDIWDEFEFTDLDFRPHNESVETESELDTLSPVVAELQTVIRREVDIAINILRGEMAEIRNEMDITNSNESRSRRKTRIEKACAFKVTPLASQASDQGQRPELPNSQTDISEEPAVAESLDETLQKMGTSLSELDNRVQQFDDEFRLLAQNEINTVRNELADAKREHTENIERALAKQWSSVAACLDELKKTVDDRLNKLEARIDLAFSRMDTFHQKSNETVELLQRELGDLRKQDVFHAPPQPPESWIPLTAPISDANDWEDRWNTLERDPRNQVMARDIGRYKELLGFLRSDTVSDKLTGLNAILPHLEEEQFNPTGDSPSIRQFEEKFASWVRTIAGYHSDLLSLHRLICSVTEAVGHIPGTEAKNFLDDLAIALVDYWNTVSGKDCTLYHKSTANLLTGWLDLLENEAQSSKWAPVMQNLTIWLGKMGVEEDAGFTRDVVEKSYHSLGDTVQSQILSQFEREGTVQGHPDRWRVVGLRRRRWLRQMHGGSIELIRPEFIIDFG